MSDLISPNSDHMNKLVNESIKVDKNTREFFTGQAQYSKLMNKDRTLICLYYNSAESDILDKFKLEIQDIIKRYKKDGFSYRVKTYSDVSFEHFGNIDMKDDDPKYSSGNTFHVEEKVIKSERNEFLKRKKGTIGALSKIRILIDDPSYDIFEYKEINEE